MMGNPESTVGPLATPPVAVQDEGEETCFLVDLRAVLDALAVRALVLDPAGRELHRTPALVAWLDRHAVGAAAVAEAARAALAALRAHAVDRSRQAEPEVFELGADRVQVRAAPCRSPARGGAPLVLVTFEPLARPARSEAELKERFGLTRTELRVAFLLAKGLSNHDIAREMVISPHTARRHTERVLAKLELRSRSEVASRLYR